MKKYLLLFILPFLMTACNQRNESVDVVDKTIPSSNSQKVDLSAKEEKKTKDNKTGIDNKAMMALIEKSEREKAKSPQAKRNQLTATGFPKNVPLDAVWVGEKERGAYLKIRAIGSDPNRFFSEIYLKNGKLYYKGPMELNPKKSQRFDFKNPSSYGFFDGRDLILKDGGILSRDMIRG